MTTGFSKAKIGDRVFDRFRQEWGVINGVYKESTYAVEVDFLENMEEYLIDGRLEKDHSIPALVWDSQVPERNWAVLPEMPKKIVTKRVKGYLNVYSDNDVTFYLSKDIADHYAASHRIVCIPVIAEYEIEE